MGLIGFAFVLLVVVLAYFAIRPASSETPVKTIGQITGGSGGDECSDASRQFGILVVGYGKGGTSGDAMKEALTNCNGKSKEEALTACETVMVSQAAICNTYTGENGNLTCKAILHPPELPPQECKITTCNNITSESDSDDLDGDDTTGYIWTSCTYLQKDGELVKQTPCSTIYSRGPYGGSAWNCTAIDGEATCSVDCVPIVTPY